MAHAESECLLLALPDPCLLAVLQCCAATDQRSVLSAARAHSRLHQAALLALRSIRAIVRQQHKADSVLLYLARHGQQVDSIQIGGTSAVVLQPLPLKQHLSRLVLELLSLQLQPGGAFHGVLGAAAGVAALRQLRLRDCKLLGAAGQALSVLPAGLEHLSISKVTVNDQSVQLATTVLQQLQQLTFLELLGVELQGPELTADSAAVVCDKASPALQPLQALTLLADLRLEDIGCYSDLTASMLSGAHNLTCLHVFGYHVEPAILAGKTQLQNVGLGLGSLSGKAAGVAELLSYLQPLQQLTRLSLPFCLRYVAESPSGSNPVVYLALTASSNLQRLNMSQSILPADAWQHLFPAGRQLPHLTSLNISDVQQASGDHAPAPEGSRLVSCCPSLQCLDMRRLHYSTEVLPPLQGLSTLHSLNLAPFHNSCILEGLMQLTQLKQLTTQSHRGFDELCLASLVSVD